jgi:hypothetical protein
MLKSLVMVKLAIALASTLMITAASAEARHPAQAMHNGNGARWHGGPGILGAVPFIGDDSCYQWVATPTGWQRVYAC